MKGIILGADGYLGWPTVMHLSKLGDTICAVDNLSKRMLELENGIEPLVPIPTLHRRVEEWNQNSSNKVVLRIGDLLNHRFVYKLLEEFRPDYIVHYAEQPSAPFSMKGREEAVYTQHNNVIGNLNLLFAIKKYVPECHLIKLGTMGSYGTPNIDIEEGYLEINHNGRTDRLPYPKLPHSFYHLSKVHDSHNVHFTTRVWNLRATDLNQGYVYGVNTADTVSNELFNTSFHYDHMFGTALNRFVVQAAVGLPLTVYGTGSQTRGIINIIDTLKCVEITRLNPPELGDCRVFNQFTEQKSVLEVAKLVQSAATKIGLVVKIDHIKNPRVEKENHYYNAKHTKLVELGLEPVLLGEDTLHDMLMYSLKHKERVNQREIMPKVTWNN